MLQCYSDDHNREKCYNSTFYNSESRPEYFKFNFQNIELMENSNTVKKKKKNPGKMMDFIVYFLKTLSAIKIF